MNLSNIRKKRTEIIIIVAGILFMVLSFNMGLISHDNNTPPVTADHPKYFKVDGSVIVENMNLQIPIQTYTNQTLFFYYITYTGDTEGLKGYATVTLRGDGGKYLVTINSVYLQQYTSIKLLACSDADGKNVLQEQMVII